MELGSCKSFNIKKLTRPQIRFPPAESPIRKTFLILVLKLESIAK